MSNISDESMLALKQRFCKDNKVAIQLFDEPYFTERIKLLDLTTEWHRFLYMIETEFDNSAEKFFEYSSDLMNLIVEYIKNSETFRSLNTSDMNLYKVENKHRQGDVFKNEYVGKSFISIDIKKANFSALVHYSKENGFDFNDNSFDYAEFMRRFTEIEYFAKSKYIRQVVFGKCNPSRQITYEKSIMNKVYEFLCSRYEEFDNSVVTFCNDEIVIDIEKLEPSHVNDLIYFVEGLSVELIPLHVEKFKLGKAVGTRIFLKNILQTESGECDKLEMKCNNPVETVFVARVLKKEMPKYSDRVFNSEYGQAVITTDINPVITFEPLEIKK